jgi:hypothetical protein
LSLGVLRTVLRELRCPEVSESPVTGRKRGFQPEGALRKIRREKLTGFSL